MTPDRTSKADLPAWATGLLRSALGGEPGARVVAALEFAAGAHAGQLRQVRAGLPPVPYITHPVGVAAFCLEWAGPAGLASPSPETLACAALLHDTIEDCAVSIDDLQSRFGAEVASLVLALTKPVLRARESSEARMRRFARQIGAAGPAAVFLKACDLVHNVSECEATPREVLRRAVARGRTHYLPLLGNAGLGEAFLDRVERALAKADAALATPDPAAGPGTANLGGRLDRALVEAGRGKIGIHDADRLLREICGVGEAIVVRFPHRGPPIVVSGGSRLRLDPGRLEQIRQLARESGGPTKLGRALLKADGVPSTDHAAGFVAVDVGFDGVDTLVVWTLPAGYEAMLPAGFSASTLLLLVLAIVARPAAELHRDVAKEALALGIELDLGLVEELGIRRGQLRQLARWRQLCGLGAEQVEAEVRAFVHSRAGLGPLWHRVRIERRIKAFPSILGKFATRYASDWPDFSTMEDIGGVRVICPTTWHVEECARFFEGSTPLRPLAGPLRRYDRTPTPQGYRGVHAIRLIRPSGEEAEVRCEVQVRTLLQDAWSTLSHNVAYKLEDAEVRRRRDELRELSTRLDECEAVASALFGRGHGPDDAPSEGPGEPQDPAM